MCMRMCMCMTVCHGHIPPVIDHRLDARCAHTKRAVDTRTLDADYDAQVDGRPGLIACTEGDSAVCALAVTRLLEERPKRRGKRRGLLRISRDHANLVERLKLTRSGSHCGGVLLLRQHPLAVRTRHVAHCVFEAVGDIPPRSPHRTTYK